MIKIKLSDSDMRLCKNIADRRDNFAKKKGRSTRFGSDDESMNYHLHGMMGELAYMRAFPFMPIPVYFEEEGFEKSADGELGELKFEVKTRTWFKRRRVDHFLININQYQAKGKKTDYHVFCYTPLLPVIYIIGMMPSEEIESYNTKPYIVEDQPERNAYRVPLWKIRPMETIYPSQNGVIVPMDRVLYGGREY